MRTDTDGLDRGSLPIADLAYTGTVTFDATSPDTKYPPIRRLRPPVGAPNVVVILLDDVGFGATTGFGGPCETPVFDRLAADGLKFTRFHTTALCSPTRAALLSGRNHHTVGMGGITEIATSAPGYNSLRPNTCAPLPEILKLNGYSTAQFGKCHEVPAWETSPVGPFDHWPHPGGGFEYFYGFLGGETNQWYPAIYENTTPIEPWGLPEDGYHFMADMTDKAISWTRQQKALAPDRPFFMYFAPGATHAPHHVPREWADRYQGRFDHGWDAMREETFARQKELGVIPAEATLTPRHAEIPGWEDMSERIKPVLARQMEVYAGFLSYTDHHVGRLVDAIEELGVLDDTLMYIIIGDNGASAEGTFTGTTNENFILNRMDALEDEDFVIAHVDDLGTPKSYNHYAIGWAHAMDTPYQWTKQVASHWGGTRQRDDRALAERHPGPRLRSATSSPTASMSPRRCWRWPGSQSRRSCTASPSTRSRASAWRTASTTPRPTSSTRRSTSRCSATGPSTTSAGRRWPSTRTRGWLRPAPLDEDVWELYNVEEDWTQSNDLAAEQPEKLAELQRLFLIQAARFNVLPLDVRSGERLNADLVGRPVLIEGNTQMFYPGMKRLTENSAINVKNKSHTITAAIEVPDGGVDGVVIAQGGAFGGWSMFTSGGHLKYCYNLLGLQTFTVTSDSPLPAGGRRCGVEFAYDGGGLGKGGTVWLMTNGTKIGEGRVDQTLPFQFSFDETVDVGCDTASPVSPEYGTTGNEFTGTISWVRIDLGDDSQGTTRRPRGQAAGRSHQAVTRVSDGFS